MICDEEPPRLQAAEVQRLVPGPRHEDEELWQRVAGWNRHNSAEPRPSILKRIWKM